MNLKEKINKAIIKHKDNVALKKKNREITKEREKYHKSVLLKEKNREASETNPHEGYFISLININKIYDNHVQAVYDFNLDIKEKEFIVFVGPSGCGKSTTLRMIAGLEEITSGDLYINNIRSNDFEPKERDISMVFQSYALYPHMTVYENMAFGLKINHYKKDEIHERVMKAAEILELTNYLDRKPGELSGGQCQRVALGRSIVRNSKLFLLDEPLSNLDAKLRVSMRSEIVKLHNRLEATSIYVTHDQTEAMTMADRIVVMNKGYIQQVGTPSEIYEKPANLFVATFIGSPAMNIFSANLTGNELTLENNFKVKLDYNLFSLVKGFYETKLKEINTRINQLKNEFINENSLIKTYERLINEVNSANFKEKYALNAQNKDEALNLFLRHNLGVEVDHYYSSEEFTDALFMKHLDSLKEFNENIKTILTQKRKIEGVINGDSYTLTLGLRPEGLKIKNSEEDENYEVEIAELLGSEYMLHFNFKECKEIVVKADNDIKIYPHDKFALEVNKSKIHIFDPITELRIEK